MKRRIFTFILIATLVFLMFALVACAGGGRCANGHDWTTISLESPNGCLENALSYDRCLECGIRRYVEIDPLGHDLVLKEGTSYLPNCVETGYEGTFECSRDNCDYVVNGAIIPALGHKDDDDNGVCDVCGNASCNHIWGDWTDNGDGTHTRICSISAGHTETADHNINGIVTIAPECDNTGEMLYTCSDCGYEYVEELPIVDHIYSENWIDNGANHIKVCEFNCNEILAEDHTYIESRTPATCESAEIITFTCECGSVKTEEGAPALEHNYQWTDNGNGTCSGVCDNDNTHVISAQAHVDTVRDNICDNCGARLECDHEFDGGVVTTPVSCAVDGVMTYTCIHCGGKSTEPISATGHNYAKSDSVPADCTNDGVDTYTCSNCGGSYTETINATGHEFIPGEPVLPTCTEEGYTIYTCSGCGISHKDDIVNPNGHTYVGEVTVSTCTGDGYTTYTCSDCGHSYVGDNVPKDGHDYAEVVVAPTCTEQGFTKHTCQREGCGYSYIDTYVDATGHDYEDVVTDPTCTEAGYTTHTCKVDACGHSYVDSYVDANGHTYDSVVTAPTCTAQGYTTHTCTVCGHEIVTSYVPAKSHTKGVAQIENPVPATCTTRGSYDNVVYCADCDAEFSRDTVEVAALGHSWGDWIDNLDVNHIRVCGRDDSHIEKVAHADTDNNCRCDDCDAEMHVSHDGNLYVCDNPACAKPLGQLLSFLSTQKTGDKVLVRYDTNTYLDVTKITTEPALPQTFILDPSSSFFDFDKYALIIEYYSDFGFSLQTQDGMYVEQSGEKLMLVSAPSGWWYVHEDGIGEGMIKLLFTGTQTNVYGITAFVEYYHNVNIGHELTISDNGDGTHSIGCVACGYQNKEEHNGGVANCTEKAICDVCGVAYGDFKHEYTTSVTNPTCTEKGFTTHTCTLCGDSYTDNEVDALGHVTHDNNIYNCEVCLEDTYKQLTAEAGENGISVGDKIVIDLLGNGDYCLDASDTSNFGYSINLRDAEFILDPHRYLITICEGAEDGTYILQAPNGKYIALIFNEVNYSRKLIMVDTIEEASSWYFTFDSLYFEIYTTENIQLMFADNPSTRAFSRYYVFKIENVNIGHEVSYVDNGNGEHTVGCSVCGEIGTEACYGGNATCVTQAKCDGCGASHGELLEHNYKKVATTPETCESAEVILYACSLCGESKRESGAQALEHDYSVKEVVAEATCLTQGTATMVCSHCGESDGIIFDDADSPALGHDPSDWKDATDGLHHIKVCQRTNCAVVLEIQEHELQRYWIDPETHRTYYADYCLDCGYLVRGDEIEEIIISNEDGEYYYVPFPVATEYELRAIFESKSGGEFCVQLEKDLTLDKPLVAPDIRSIMLSEGVTLTGTGQTEDGKYALIVSDQELFLHACGGTFSVKAPEGEEAYVAIVSICLNTYTLDGEIPGKFVTTGDAIFYNKGGGIIVYSEDEFVTGVDSPVFIVDENADPTGALLVVNGTYKNWDPTAYVPQGLVDKHTDSEEKHYIVTSTIDGNGDTWYKVDRHYMFDKITTPPTCVDEGYTTYICQTCGEEFVEDIVPATGVHITESVTTLPTCTEKGYTTHTCTVCGETSVDSYTDAIPHLYEWTEISDTQCEGVCLVCGHAITENHTITADGCSKCGRCVVKFTLKTAGDGTNYYAIAGRGKDFDDIVVDGVVDLSRVPSEIDGIPVTTIGDITTIVVDGVEENVILSPFSDLDDSVYPSISVIIPENITDIHYGAFYNCDSLTSIVIPSTVNTIGYQAFDNCENLTDVTIEEGVTTIDGYAFYYCTSLTEIDIPDSVTEIGHGAFELCKNLESVNFGTDSQLEEIGQGAFMDCANLETINIPSGVTIINNDVFKGCSSLETIIIPENVTNINHGAFANCSSLTSVVILSDDLVDVAGASFEGCESLTDIYYAGTEDEWNVVVKHASSNEKFINANVHFESSAVHDYDVEVVHNPTCTEDGYTEHMCQCGIVGYIDNQITAPGHSLEYYDAQSVTCTEIGWDAYEVCTVCGHTTYEEIPATGHKHAVEGEWTTIDNEYCQDVCLNEGCDYDFGLDPVKHDIGPNGCTRCGWCVYVFEQNGVGNYKLVSLGKDYEAYLDSVNGNIEIPSTINSGTVNQIGDHGSEPVNMPFYNNDFSSRLTGVSIPATVAYICRNAFRNCTNLADVKFEEGSQLVTMQNWAFANTAITSISIPETAKKIYHGTFEDCTKLESVDFGQNVTMTEIVNMSFKNCTSLKTISIPDSVTIINSGAFAGCSSLESVIFGQDSKLTTFGNHVFDSCVNLKSINIPQGVTDIGNGESTSGTSGNYSVFLNCSSLESIVIPDGVTVIGYKTFEGCSSLKTIELSKNLTTIEAYAFSGCSSLKTLSIPDSVNTLGEAAFRGCAGVESVYIPVGITNIPGDAFYLSANSSTSALTDIYYAGTEEQWAQLVATMGEDNQILISANVNVHYNSTNP